MHAWPRPEDALAKRLAEMQAAIRDLKNGKAASDARAAALERRVAELESRAGDGEGGDGA